MLKKALQKVFKIKSSQKSAKKSIQKSSLAQEWAQKNNFFPKKKLNKVFLVKEVLIKGNAQKSIPSGEIPWKYIFINVMWQTDVRNDEMLLDSPAEAMMIS